MASARVPLLGWGQLPAGPFSGKTSPQGSRHVHWPTGTVPRPAHSRRGGVGSQARPQFGMTLGWREDGAFMASLLHFNTFCPVLLPSLLLLGTVPRKHSAYKSPS